jgi:hypothetical protein
LFFLFFCWRKRSRRAHEASGRAATSIASLFTPKTYGGKLGGNSGTNQSNRTTTVVLDASTVYHEPHSGGRGMSVPTVTLVMRPPSRFRGVILNGLQAVKGSSAGPSTLPCYPDCIAQPERYTVVSLQGTPQIQNGAPEQALLRPNNR